MRKEKPPLSSYFLAGFPCILMDTVEEDRAIETVVGAARTAKVEGQEEFSRYAVVVWRITTGLEEEEVVGGVDTGISLLQNQGVDTRQLQVALKWVAEQPSGTRVIGVFLNLRKLIDNPIVIQTMKDAVNVARKRGNHIILVGPSVQLPPELSESVVQYDFPLPSFEQIREQYGRLIGAYGEEIEIPKGETARSLVEKAAQASVGMTLLEAENAVALSITETSTVDIPMIQQAKANAIKKSEVLELFQTEETMENVGDFDLLKEWMSKRREVFSEEARRYGLPNPKGVLLLGVPGTGKSLAAKAAANFLGLPLVKFDIGAVFKKYVGESEGAVRKALITLEAVAPVVVWFDELEKGFAGISSSGATDSGVTSRVLSTILTWMQERRALVFCFATVNDIRGLPPEVYRAGRFDALFSTDLPQYNGRKEIFAIHLRKRGRDVGKFDLKQLAVKSVGLVGAEIEHVIEEAMFTAFSDGGREFTTEDILKELKLMVPQSETDKERIGAIREFCKTRTRPVSSESPAWLSRAAENQELKAPKRRIVKKGRE